MEHQLVLVTFGDSVAAHIILDGMLVYHEDDDPLYHNHNYSASRLAASLAAALEVNLLALRLDPADLDQCDWTHEAIFRAVIDLLRGKAPSRTRTGNALTVDERHKDKC